MKKLMKLGITGGMGSGKTSVCKVFGILGIPVFFADPEAQILMNSKASIIRGINDIAGKDMYPGGILNREELAGIIFKDPDKLKKVNSLVHPFVFDRFNDWAENQTAPYVILEAAILFESGGSVHVDRIVTVTAPLEERISRLTAGDRLTREQVVERIRNQMDDEERITMSDYVINNSENEMIIPVILGIHEDILSHSDI
ncbi:MAG: dephospho-CoA kinase [Bacteroidales bacterium]|jgi:dephospho-CoA kinase|nr:dephospho-CoA kinase [Bacteroidales bacterium]